MSVWKPTRYAHSRYPWFEEPPVIAVENAIASTARLHRRGVKLENAVYNPLVTEGSQYQTTPGDDLDARIRIERTIVTEDGQTHVVVQEAVDVGKSVPQYVQSFDEGITDEERAQGDAIREQWNQQIFEANIANNYTAPYVAIESQPDAGYQPSDPGFVESAPIAVPQNTYTPPASYQNNEVQVNYGNTNTVSVGGEMQDQIVQPEQTPQDLIEFVQTAAQTFLNLFGPFLGGGEEPLV